MNVLSVLLITKLYKIAFRSKETSKNSIYIEVETKNITEKRHFFVATTFWRHPWSVTEQTYSNIKS